MRPTILALLVAIVPTGLLAQAPAVDDLPEPIAAMTRESFEACRQAGGNPSLAAGYSRQVELNGDGEPDYLVDFTGLVCEGAWSYFCGSAGCPVSVWLSGPAGLGVAWSDYAQAAEIDGDAVVVSLHGQLCTPPRPGFEGCEQRLTFAGQVPPPPEPAPMPEPVPVAEPAPVAAPEPVAEPEPAPAPSVTLPAATAAGWTLREVPGSTPVAVSAGAGIVQQLAAFCLAGEPFLALVLDPAPAAEAVRADFVFEAGASGSEARREDGAGGAYVIALRGQPLVGLLSGRDSRAGLRIDGADQGVLSLSGSTKAIRGALAACG